MPIGEVPLNDERTLEYGPAGAGAGPLKSTRFAVAPNVGRNEPVTIWVSSGRSEPAASSNVRFTLFTSSEPPVSVIRRTRCPAGPTTMASMSSGNVCVIPVIVTLTSVTLPLNPATLIVDG